MNSTYCHALLALTACLLHFGCDSSVRPDQPKPAQPPVAQKTEQTAKQSRVYILAPLDGATVYETVSVRLGLTGYTLGSPSDVGLPNRGYFHLLIDSEPVPKGETIQPNPNHTALVNHETHVELTFPPGNRTLTAQLSDPAGISLGPEMSATIRLLVRPSPKSMRAFFIEPQPGQTVRSPVRVVFGVEGMEVTPAGQQPRSKISGHHHLLVNTPPIPAGMLIPMNGAHLHFNAGETQTTLELSPGRHRLTLQLGDGGHLAYGPSLSTSIEIVVE